MTGLTYGTVGILPAGALGVGLFYHLTRQLTQVDGGAVFLERRGSASAQVLRHSGALQIAVADQVHALPTAEILRPDLLACARAGTLPEVLLVCPNPDQLLDFITTSVELLVLLADQEQLQQEALPFPFLVLCSNGIYFQRFRQIFIEKIEEAILFGRLPDLWPDQMPRIVSRFLRGVTIQTGLREGAGAEAVYRPGPSGLTRIAGGDRPSRHRCCQILTERGGWFEAVDDRTPTRIEFDKALVNLACNLLGQLYAIDADGVFHPLTVGEIIAAEHHPQMRQMAHHIFQVGKTVRAYRPEEALETIFQQFIEVCQPHAAHMPSSLQWVSLKLRLGNLKPEMTPTEAWLVEPMLRYAKAAELYDAVDYFEGLKHQLVDKLAIAIQHYQALSSTSAATQP